MGRAAPLFIVLVLGLLGVAVGVYVSRRDQRVARLSRADRRELSARRLFMSELQQSATQHAMLDDNYAVIVLDELEKYRRATVR